MLKIYITFLIALGCVVGVFSQTAEPTATPPAEDTDVVKISTNLIQIDVTVTDKKGKPVVGLKAEDFEIFENGKKQEISNFSFISTKSEKEKNAPTDVAPILPANRLKPDQIRRTLALVVDDLGLSFNSAYYVRRSLKKFVDEQMQEGDLVAIIRTGAGVGALQQFTSDKRMLYEAIKRVRWNPRGSGRIGAFAPLQAVDSLVRDPKAAVSGEEDPDDERGMDSELNEFRQNLFATGTLGALGYIVSGMKDLPGRKSVLFFSEGLQIYTQTSKGFLTSDILDHLRKLIDTANRASVVIYTLDARGLVTTGLTAADDTRGRTFEQTQTAISDRNDDLLDTQDGIRYLAEETGGFAVLNNNDLNTGIERILSDQSYYLIGYQPNDETFDPEKLNFNKLSVKVKGEDFKVRYRSGFLGVSDEKIQNNPVALNTGQKVANALTSPFAINEINLTLNTLFKSDAKKNLYLYSFLFIDGKDLKFVEDKDGKKKAVFDVWTVNFGDNGVPTDELGKTFSISLDNQEQEQLINQGLVYSFVFPVKKAGAYQMRVVLRDHNSDKVGSANEFVLVPKLKEKRLSISGIALENISYQNWNNNQAGASVKSEENPEKPTINFTPLATTALRQFRRGTILSYGFEIYNAKFKNGQRPQLETQIKIFRDGELILEGNRTPVDVSSNELKAGGALNLSQKMSNGEYILQIIVTDKLAKKKQQVITEFVQFEIVD